MATVPRFDPDQFATATRRPVAQPRHHRLLRARLDLQGHPRRRRARRRRGPAGRPDRLRERQVGGRQPRHPRLARARRAELRRRDRPVEQHRRRPRSPSASAASASAPCCEQFGFGRPTGRRPARRGLRPAPPGRALGPHPSRHHRLRPGDRGDAAAAGARLRRHRQRRPSACGPMSCAASPGRTATCATPAAPQVERQVLSRKTAADGDRAARRA